MLRQLDDLRKKSSGQKGRLVLEASKHGIGLLSISSVQHYLLGNWYRVMQSFPNIMPFFSMSRFTDLFRVAAQTCLDGGYVQGHFEQA